MRKWLRILFRESVFLAILFIGVSMFGGSIEGHWLPVIKDFEIERIEPADYFNIELYGDFDKVRDCSFDHIEWYFGTPELSTKLDFQFREETDIKRQGQYGFGPWRINVQRAQFEQTFATVYHRCHPFWLTATPFYNGWNL